MVSCLNECLADLPSGIAQHLQERPPICFHDSPGSPHRINVAASSWVVSGLSIPGGLQSWRRNRFASLTGCPRPTNLPSCALFQLSRIRKIRRFLDLSSARCSVNALFLSRIDYCNSLYVGLPDEFLKRLQCVQNSAARMIFNLRKHDPVSHHLKTLRWLSVPNRAKYRVACLSFRCLNGSAPSYLSSLLTPYSRTRDLRSCGKNLLVTKSYRLAQYGERAFSRAAPLIWNSLSDTVRQAPTFSTFRSRLFKELFSAANVD